MKNDKFSPLLRAIWHKKQRSLQDRARHSFVSSPFRPQRCRNFAVFPLRKAPEKIPAGCLFWLSDALSRTFFPKKYLINSTARPFFKGRAV